MSMPLNQALPTAPWKISLSFNIPTCMTYRMLCTKQQKPDTAETRFADSAKTKNWQRVKIHITMISVPTKESQIELRTVSEIQPKTDLLNCQLSTRLPSLLGHVGRAADSQMELRFAVRCTISDIQPKTDLLNQQNPKIGRPKFPMLPSNEGP